MAFTYGDTQTVQGKSAETDDSDEEDEIVDSDEFGRYFWVSLNRFLNFTSFFSIRKIFVVKYHHQYRLSFDKIMPN